MCLQFKPDGNWAMVNGAPTDPNVKQYRDGWLRVIQPAIDGGAIKMVSDTYTEKWDPNNAMKAAENFLTANNDKIDVVLAMNDGTGGGVVQALKARNLNGKVLVTGQDGELAAIQRIVEGDQAMTVWSRTIRWRMCWRRASSRSSRAKSCRMLRRRTTNSRKSLRCCCCR